MITQNNRRLSVSEGVLLPLPSPMTEDEQKKENLGKKVDKLVVGAIIGGAIGSVIGLTFAPKQGKKTRKEILSRSKEFLQSHERELETAKKLTKETTRGMFKLIKNILKK